MRTRFFVNFALMALTWKKCGTDTATLLLQGVMFLFLCASCGETTVCEDATATTLRIGFYSSSGNSQATASAVDSITVYAIGRDNDRIYDNQKDVMRIELPLNPGADSTGYVFKFPGATDTIWTVYERNLHLISVDCGFTMFYDIQDFRPTSHFIYTHEISRNLVSNTLDENIKLFYSAPAPAR